MFVVVSILKTFYVQMSVSVSESVIFVANISVFGILENFHIGVLLHTVMEIFTVYST